MPPQTDTTLAPLPAPMAASLMDRLASLSIPTPDPVAFRILELGSNPDAGIREYAAVLRSDPACVARLLRLANSAFCAQRTSVTTIERACMLLGVGRVRAVALGIHLSRAAQGSTPDAFTRQVWGESLFRACLATSLSKLSNPTYQGEAFVIGLLLDVGVSLLTRLFPGLYPTRESRDLSPAVRAAWEREHLGVSHADVAAALTLMWKLPDLLAFPIAHHHQVPRDLTRPEPVHRLHRLAYAVGIVELAASPARVRPDTLPSLASPTRHAIAERLLTIDHHQSEAALAAARAEYALLADTFTDIAQPVDIADALLERLQTLLTSTMDQILLESMGPRPDQPLAHLTLGGHRVEIQREPAGKMTAFLYDSKGQRLVGHSFFPSDESASTIAGALGLSIAPNDDVDALTTLLDQASNTRRSA